MTTLIKNGLISVDGDIRKKNILIDNDVIQDIGTPDTVGADEIINAAGCYIFPGLIDAHVHFHMLSGNQYTDDDFETGTLGAVRGGVTSVIDFARPISGRPPIDGVKARILEAAGNSYTDFALHMSMQGWYSNKLANYSMLSELVEMGISSLKFFTTYGETKIEDEIFEMMLPHLKKLNLLPMIHAENDAVCTAAKADLTAKGMTGFQYHALARPREAEIEEIRFLVGLAAKYDIAMYIAHVSTEESVELIRKARKNGIEILGETCPHYLIKTEEVYDTDSAVYSIASPPLRTKQDAQALFEALEDGTLQCVSSDHCAFAKAVKRTGKTCFDTPAGISGVETILPLLYSYGIKKGKLSLQKMLEVTSANPARIFRLQKKGGLSVGKDADIVIFDPSGLQILSADKLASKSSYCLYEAMECAGTVKMTLLRGNAVYGCNAMLKTGQYVKCC